MEPEGSLPHSQQPANCLYPEPELSSPVLTACVINIDFEIQSQGFDLKLYIREKLGMGRKYCTKMKFISFGLCKK